MTLVRRDTPMTVAEFFAFTDTRPDGETWELIDGEPVRNPSPSRNHQKIMLNLMFELQVLARQGTAWEVLPGIGVQLSQTSMPVPDVLIRPVLPAGNFCDDMIVAFEVLSPSSRSMDLRWKRSAYPKLPSLQHYVVIHQDEVRVRCYDRADGWAERQLGPADGSLRMKVIDVRLDVAALYRDTGL